MIPKFKNTDEEAEFWNSHDSTDYIDWEAAQKTVFPYLKTSTESISIRLPSPLLARIKGLANEKDIPYFNNYFFGCSGIYFLPSATSKK